MPWSHSDSKRLEELVQVLKRFAKMQHEIREAELQQVVGRMKNIERYLQRIEERLGAGG